MLPEPALTTDTDSVVITLRIPLTSSLRTTEAAAV
jgi:hypothetical protein